MLLALGFLFELWAKGVNENCMKIKITPEECGRAEAFALWSDSPMPMVTVTKTFDVTRIRRVAQGKGLQFNMLLCWCIGLAACKIKEFFSLPVAGEFYKYDRLAVNVIVNNCRGGINSCDVPFSDDLERFAADYAVLTKRVADSCKSVFDDEAMVVGTSAMVETELDSVVNQYTDKFCNPMLFWGKYRRGWFKVSLPVSFQFHHVQMDGGHAARFFAELQRVINSL